jgi:hypothetical protein
MSEEYICESTIYKTWSFWFVMVILYICIVIGFTDIITWFFPTSKSKKVKPLKIKPLKVKPLKVKPLKVKPIRIKPIRRKK